jgi:hypothetical protein
VNLPFDKLDALSLQKEVDRIGAMAAGETQV